MTSQARRSASPATGRKKPDWDAVERDYRTDTFTLRELAQKHGVTHTTISRRAEKHGWTKDLTKAIRQATNSALVHQTVQQKCTDAHQAATDAVLVAAEINTQVILRHRDSLRRLAAIKGRLLDQIEQAAEQMPDLAEAIDMVRKEDERGVDKANDALRKAMARPALVDDLKKLAEVDEKIRKGEREAFNIASADDPDAAAKPKRVVLDFEDAEVRAE